MPANTGEITIRGSTASVETLKTGAHWRNGLACEPECDSDPNRSRLYPGVPAGQPCAGEAWRHTSANADGGRQRNRGRLGFLRGPGRRQPWLQCAGERSGDRRGDGVGRKSDLPGSCSGNGDDHGHRDGRGWPVCYADVYRGGARVRFTAYEPASRGAGANRGCEYDGGRDSEIYADQCLFGPRSDPLSFSATSSSTAHVTAELTGNELTINAIKALVGSAVTITVTATDGGAPRRRIWSGCE